MNSVGISVRNLMSSPVIKIQQTETLESVAKIMSENNFGSVIIADQTDKLVGIITERDIVTRLTARNRLPSEVQVEEIMSSPVITIDFEEIMSSPVITIDCGKDITEAARSMRSHNIRRLVVLESEKIVGIITSRDILDEMVTGER
jgi:CBS domain-containing protein